MLQDQLMSDVEKNNILSHIVLNEIKSSTNYYCSEIDDNCQVGKESGCMLRQACTYSKQKSLFNNSLAGLTNYSFMGKEYISVNKIESRPVLILDEAHNIETEMVNQFSVKITKFNLGYYTNDKIDLPKDDFGNVSKAIDWLRKYHDILKIEEKELNVRIKNYIEGKSMNGAIKVKPPAKMAKRLANIIDHEGTINCLINDYDENPYNFIHIFSYNNLEKYYNLEIKPLYVDQYSMNLFHSRGEIRIYMSAFLGDRKTFCETIGKSEDEVEWLSVNNFFPVENRLVKFIPSAKISNKFYDANIEKMLEAIIEKCDEHNDERGIIHCHSYKLGEDIYNALKQTIHSKRIVYPKNAAERIEAFEKHSKNSNSILISPSMTEGYDFKDDLARWQIIAKIPYLNMIDPWVNRRKLLSNEWYLSKTVETIVQTCGRACRHEKDFGVTYILDSDFGFFFSLTKHIFPKWFKDALIMK